MKKTCSCHLCKCHGSIVPINVQIVAKCVANNAAWPASTPKISIRKSFDTTSPWGLPSPLLFFTVHFMEAPVYRNEGTFLWKVNDRASDWVDKGESKGNVELGKGIVTDTSWNLPLSSTGRPVSTSTVSDGSLKGSEAQPESSHSSSTIRRKQQGGRKPYQLKKTRESWFVGFFPATTKSLSHIIYRRTPEEHERFVEALRKYGRNWKKIRECVGGKDLFQVRTQQGCIAF